MAGQHRGLGRARAAPGRDGHRAARRARRRRRVPPGPRRAGRGRPAPTARPRSAPARGAPRPGAAPPGPGGPARRAGRARGAGRRHVQHVPRRDRRRAGRRQHDLPRSSRTSDDSDERRRGVGGVEAGRRRGRRAGRGAGPAPQPGRPRSSAPATTSRSRSRRASSTRTRLFATLDEVDRVTRGAVRRVEGRARRARSRARFGCAVDELRPVALRRPVLPGPAGGRRRSTSTRGSQPPTSRR